MRRLPLAGSLLMAVVLLVAGCDPAALDTPAPVAPGTATPAGTAFAPDSGSACDLPVPLPWDSPPAPPDTPLPASFVPVAVHRCEYTRQVRPGDGEWMIRYTQRLTGGLDALVSALRLPGASASGPIACTSEVRVPIVLTVTDAEGHELTPKAPLTSCSYPLPPVLAALAAVSWETVSIETVGQTRSPVELETHCADWSRPVEALMAERADVAVPVGPAFPDHPRTLRVCRYELDPTRTVGSRPGERFPVGHVVAGPPFTGPAEAAFLAALDRPSPHRPCVAGPAPFAVLTNVDGTGPSVVVELGGCWRALDGSGVVRQLDLAATALLPS